ncbi:hypothetical protein SK3146_04454 [Paenibacillus konkukensis]|uniref:Uncharacterized protein n=1 Tax=Paenibacillus konkukensis TaxID=2020716 RepID=A0ABY4RRK0_9BACL|nr:hypothetical protein SK3146_04454 [Paenibacillus konkukensis]
MMQKIRVAGGDPGLPSLFPAFVVYWLYRNFLDKFMIAKETLQ